MRQAFIVGVAVMLACVTPVAAQQPGQTQPQTQPADQAQQSGETTITGTVVSSSSTSLVIRTESGEQKTFVVDDTSTIPSGLAAGARVSVRYTSQEGGQMRVASVARETGARAETTREPGVMERGTATGTAADRGTGAGAEAEQGAGERLPETASPLPLVALAGALSAAAGLALRARKR
jgi:hypothetical protein